MTAPTASSTSKQLWADGPIELITTPQYQTKKTDVFTTGATHMALLHNSILRGYNSIYNQIPCIQEADKGDFIGYSLTWYKFVKSHHKDEEANLFTKIEDLLQDKSVFEGTHEERESFLCGLDEFNAYLTSLPSPSAFSPAKLQQIMSSFQNPFQNHFHSEITTIAALADHPRAPEEGTSEAATARAIFKAWGKSTVTKAGMADVAPFFILNLDRTAEDGIWADWPPMPAPMKWTLLSVAGAVHGYLRFASCDTTGQPRELWALRFPAPVL
ncbi:hypothetical protein CONLIGDRAFT_657466 [Coniochaeta ligniaria NRRL 30616]|uniref:Hemerythrin-like domain-containing protein n=1 Tax=Coniochaeta ligniaria NRRL 30616 TaxID=1408157 RepID=A0A1J7J8R0_9PEZI|nr:hypothetical protein CONLIGDRAFT_657466 [Coniochaeta ligniaria NRRL 30616]